MISLPESAIGCPAAMRLRIDAFLLRLVYDPNPFEMSFALLVKEKRCL